MSHRLFAKMAIAMILMASSAQAGFSYTGATLTENFDGLPSTGTTNLNGTVGMVQALSGTAFDGAKIGGTGTTLTLIASDGSGNAGALYSFGAANSTNRALGSIASGTNVVAFGVVITNNSGAALTSVSLSFLGEEFRNSTSAVNRLAFAYGVSGGTANASNYLTDASLTANTAFDVVGDAPVASNGVIPPIITPISGTILVNVGVGESLFLRFTDTNDVGNDAGLGIDNFSFSATTSGTPAVPEPASVAMLGMGLVGASLLARRRTRAAC